MRRIVLMMLCGICWLIGAGQISFGQKPELFIQAGHSGKVLSIVFNHNGQILASGSEDKTVKLWDVNNGKVLRTLSAHSSEVTSVAFHPSGKMLASGGNDKTIRLWDVETGKEIHNLREQEDEVKSIDFSPDGKTLVSVSDFGGRVRFWDVETGKRVNPLEEKNFHCSSIAFSPDGKTLACGDSKNVVLWNFESRTKLKTLTENTNATIDYLVFSPDERILASTHNGGTTLWDVSSGEQLRTLNANHPITFSPDGQLLAGSGGHIQLWDVKTGDALQTFEGRSPVVFSPNKRDLTLASGGSGNSIKLWNLNSGRALRNLVGHFDGVESVEFSPNNKILASGGVDKTIKLWNVETGELLRTLNGHTLRINSLTFHSGGKVLASGSGDNTIKLWDVETGKELQTLTTPSNRVSDLGVRSVKFSSDGETLISINPYEQVLLWDAKSGKLLKTFSTISHEKGDVDDIDVNPNGKIAAIIDQSYVVSHTGTNTLSLWDIETGKELRVLMKFKFMKGISPQSITFSPNGKILASIHENDTIKFWNVETGESLQSFEGFRANGIKFKFSPDGKIIAGIDSDNIILWDIENGKKLRILTEFNSRASRIAFSPDGKLLASDGKDGIKLWNIEKESARMLAWESPALTSITSSAINLIAFSPDGKTLASANEKHQISLWTTRNGKDLNNLTGLNDYPLRSLVFSPDGKNLVTDNRYSEFHVWEVESGKELKYLPWKSASGSYIKYSPDGKLIATNKNGITLWETASGRELYSLSGGGSSIVFSPDGKIVVGSDSNSITFWNVETGTKLGKIEEGSKSIAISSDGRTLASHIGYKIKLWDLGTGKELRTFVGHSDLILSLAFSQDGKILASSSSDNTIKLWDVENGKELKTLIGHFSDVNSIEFSPDGKILASGSSDAQIKLWDVSIGKELCSLNDIDEKNWLVTTPEGFFDGTPNAWKQLIWRFNNNTFDYGAVELYFNDFFYPNLLQDVLAGKSPKAPAGQELEKKDRRQPKVEIASANLQNDQRTAKIRLQVTDNNAEKKQSNHNSSSGAQDLRLFRNGSLVKIWHGDVLQGKSSVTLEADVPIVAGENNFTTYAFNSQNVKSNDDVTSIKGGDSLKRDGTLYVLAIGVNQYANERYNLKFAVPDVEKITETVKFQQDKLAQDSKIKQYAKTEIITLTDSDATKENILLALRRFSAGEKAPIPANASDKLKTELAKIKPTQPEDALIIHFSGHGTSREQRFYLLPHNFTDPQELEKQGVSDIELNQTLEKVDAGKLLMIIDACQSGQALGEQSEGRAPMNSKGLAQLAYDKGMLILTAAQSYQAALEAPRIGDKKIEHGLLTYTLLEAMRNPQVKADKDDNQLLWEREWFDYATNQVPLLQLEAMQQRNADIKQTGRGDEIIYLEGDDPNAAPDKRRVQTPRVFYRREAETKPLIVAKP